VISFLFVFAYLMSCMHAEIQVTEFGHQSYDLQESYDVFTIGDPVQIGAWVKPPDIYICSGTPITIQRVNKALNYWKKLGYKFGIIYEDVACMQERDMNIIKISLPDNTFVEPNLAMTRTARITSTQEIVAARIFIHAFAVPKERVLEHEIGHALGWQHYSRKYHIMHPNWNYGGHDDKGLKVEVD
jgi:hypothetical protein